MPFGKTTNTKLGGSQTAKSTERGRGGVMCGGAFWAGWGFAFLAGASAVVALGWFLRKFDRRPLQ